MLWSVKRRVLVWPTALTVFWAVALALVLSASSELAFYGGLLVIGIATLSAVPALALAVGFALGQCWTQLLSALVLPLAILIAWLNIDAVWQSAIIAGGYAHLAVMRPFYLSYISHLAAGQKRDPVVFDWDGLTSAVFDESDEIASLHPSASWKERAGLSCDVTQVGSAGGHFYVIRLGC